MQSREFIKEQDDVIKLKDKSSSKAQEFVDKIYKTGYINPLDSSLVVLYSTGDTFSQFQLQPAGENTVRINFMQAHPLRSGAGTKGMQKLQKLAAEAGITLTGDIWKKGPVKPAALKKFYKKMGFTVKGTNITWTPPAKVNESQHLTPQHIHKLADKKKIKWDNEPGFLKLTKRLTGKSHLDDLDQTGLKKVRDHLQHLDEQKRYVSEKLRERIDQALTKYGYRMIGSGVDAEVWIKDAGKVAKIIISEFGQSQAIKTADTFYKFSEKYKLPNLPRYIDIDGSKTFKFKIGGVPFAQYNMEQLDEITNQLDRQIIYEFSDAIREEVPWEKLPQLISYSNHKAQILKRLKKPEYKLLYNTMQVLHKLGESMGFSWDIHEENVMRRPGTGELVITDPWVHY